MVRARRTPSTSRPSGATRAWTGVTCSTATCCSTCRGSFDVTSSFRFLSGRPIDATFGSDANGDRISVDRPYSAPGVSFQRNAFRNEPLKDVSLRLQWKYKFAGDHTAIFSFEAFNLFNWDNIELSGTTGDQLLLGAGAARLRLQRADQPELPVTDGPGADVDAVRKAAAEQRAWQPAADSAGSTIQVLGVHGFGGVGGFGSGGSGVRGPVRDGVRH